ncbi:hypothetical protein [Pseudovibrio exalbescens]|uniref:hypothetical protein n=1 Tax=Pseudovibrio exalbescens TaxID=197461 RepID=UPI00041E5ACC|nr:hypothetical protein [Pseudovibrio exalbescens]
MSALLAMATGAVIADGLLYALAFTGPAEYLMGAAAGALFADRIFSFLRSSHREPYH